MTFVPNYEERYYRVHPSQLPWAMHQLRSIPGFQVHHYDIGADGMAMILVYAPIGAPDTDWRAPQAQRRRWPRFNRVQVARGLAVAAVAVSLAYIAYGLFVDAAASTQDPAGASAWDTAGRAVGDAVDAIVRMITTLVVLVALGAVAVVAVKVWGMAKK